MGIRVVGLRRANHGAAVPTLAPPSHVGEEGEVGPRPLILEPTPRFGSCATVRVRGSGSLDVNRVELGRIQISYA